MTSWVTIPNTDVDAESPLDVDLATAYRDNCIAITEGASGAPKIQTAALDADVVTAAKLDFANCDGPFHGHWTEYPGRSSTSVAFVTFQTLQIYVPANANDLTYMTEMRTDGTYTGYFRLSCASANGTELSTIQSSYVWRGPGTLDISSESGWTEIDLQYRIANVAGDVYATTVSLYMS